MRKTHIALCTLLITGCASKVRAGSPQELEKTTSELEQSPELIDTMAE